MLCFMFAEPRSLAGSAQCGPANCAALYTGLVSIGSSHRGECPGNRRIRRDVYSSGSDEIYSIVHKAEIEYVATKLWSTFRKECFS